MSQAMTVPGLAEDAARRWPDEEAVVDGARRVSFAQLAACMRDVAAGFVAAGLRPGQRVAIWAPNGLDWIQYCLGLHAAGGVLVPLNTRFKPAEARDILVRSGCVMAVGAGEFLGNDYAAWLRGMDLPALRVIQVGDGAGADAPAFLAAATAADRAEADRRRLALGPDDLSDIMFTSGTTGAPKGAMATHGQTVTVARLWARATGVRAGDRFLILWPFFHCAGYKAGWVVNLAAGLATLPEAVLEPAALLARVAAEKVTVLPGPPTLFQTLLALQDRPAGALASVRLSITGAATVAPALIAAMRGTLGIPEVLTGYGLTETSGTVTMSCPDDPPEVVATSCGRAIEGVELACVDEDGTRVEAGVPGEVLVRGMNVMRGYLDDPEATAAAIDAAGWLHTGDIGVLDAQGYLRITDRKKDMYISGGFNCYPAEIEKMLAAHPAVLQVAVTGRADERLGEVGVAYVVLKAGAAVTQAELIGWCRERMANYKVPRMVRFVPALPVNATGKVQKFKLAEI